MLFSCRGLLHFVRSGANFEAALFVAFTALVLAVLVAIQGSQPVLGLLALALAVAQTPQELAFLLRARLVIFILVLELLGRLTTFVSDIFGRHGWLHHTHAIPHMETLAAEQSGRSVQAPRQQQAQCHRK